MFHGAVKHHDARCVSLQTGSIKIAFYTQHEDAGLPVVARLYAPYEAVKRFLASSLRFFVLTVTFGIPGGGYYKRTRPVLAASPSPRPPVRQGREA